MKQNKNLMSLQLQVSDFLPASEDEKQGVVVMRESVSFWKDGFRRLRKNKLAMVSLVVIIAIMIFAFIIPSFYPYSYEQQIRGSENLGIMESPRGVNSYTIRRKIFPHFLGTDSLR